MKTIFSSVLMSLIIVETKPEGLYSILLKIGMCTIFYGVIMILLKGFEKKELNFFTSIMKEVFYKTDNKKIKIIDIRNLYF